MAIVSSTLLWRNLWCSKKEKRFKEVYQLPNLSPSTSTPSYPNALPNAKSFSKPSETNFQVTQNDAELQGVIKIMLVEGQRAHRTDCCINKFMLKHMIYNACVVPEYGFHGNVIVLSSPPPFSFCPCDCLSCTISLCQPHKLSLYSGWWE